MIESVAFIRVFVSDLARSVEFYTEKLELELGLRLNEHHWAQFKTAGAIQALEEVQPTDLDEDETIGRFVGASFVVADNAKVHETLRQRGVEFTRLPEKMPWGGTMADFRDPDDNVLTLVQLPKA